MGEKGQKTEKQKHPDIGWSQKLRCYHQKSGLSLWGLSRQSGVSEKVIVGIEDGSILHPDIHDIYKLTLAFGITFNDLLYSPPFQLIEKQTENGTEWGVCPNGDPNSPEYHPVGKREDAIILLDWINRNTTPFGSRRPEGYDPKFRESTSQG